MAPRRSSIKPAATPITVVAHEAVSAPLAEPMDSVPPEEAEHAAKLKKETSTRGVETYRGSMRMAYRPRVLAPATEQPISGCARSFIFRRL
jgi:hypothetical protein